MSRFILRNGYEFVGVCLVALHEAAANGSIVLVTVPVDLLSVACALLGRQGRVARKEPG